jgi:outer membrane protein
MNSPVRLFALAILTLVPSTTAFAEKKGEKKTEQTQQLAADLSKPLTLDEAIRIGLQNQQTLGIARVQVLAAKARVTQARAAYFPQITPSYSYNSQLTTQRFNGQTQTGTVEQSIAQIGARQLIFDMGKRELNVDASRANARGAELNVLDARQAVIVNITTNYYEYLRRRELVRVAEASVERAKTVLEATKAFVEAGTAPKKDILQAQADLDNANVQLSIAKNDVSLASTALKASMGVLTPMPVVIPDAQVPAPDPTPDTLTTADYLNRAFASRPDLKREGEFITADRRSVRIAEINSGFQVEADITEGYRIDPNPGENRTFGTTFSYPLFDAGATRAQVRQARATLEQSRRQLELTKQGIQQEVENAYLTREEARLRYQATQSALKAAKENYDAAREAQREGAGNIIDVITAQTQLVTAETNAVQAVYDFHTSDARLKRAIGENDPNPGGK